MQKAFTRLLLLTGLFLAGTLQKVRSQQCTSFGDPVINITFGAGANPGPAFPAASRSYSFIAGDCPQDGSYTIINSTYSCNGATWFSYPSDHTGNRNGYFMLINASFNPGDFYLDTVKGLCANTTYQFAAWITNVLVPSACGGSGIAPNITFRIEPTGGGTPLAIYNTGDIASANGASWQQYGLVFTTPPGVSDIVLRMTNNAPGGCGNDLALDDITFRPCGPQVKAGISGGAGSDTVDFCLDLQQTLTLNGAISAGYNAPRYQWQVSSDDGQTWADIPGQTAVDYTRPPSAVAGNYKYRLVVGEGTNVALPSCRVSSNNITIRVHPKPIPAAANNGPKCEGDSLIIKAHDGLNYAWTGPNGFMATGDSLVLRNISPSQAGIYHVLVTSQYGCYQDDATSAIVYPRPVAKWSIGSPVCHETSVSLVDESTAINQTIVKWKWDLGDGDSSLISSPAHTWSEVKSYAVSLKITTDKGCTAVSTTNPFVVHPRPRVNFGLPKICISDPQALFTDSSAISDGTQNSFTYRWDFGEPASGAANTSTQQNGAHKYLAAGAYVVGLRVTSDNGCVRDTARDFMVNGDNPQAAFTSPGDPLCSNQPVMLTDASTVSPGSIVKTIVYWDYQSDPAIQTTDDEPSKSKQYEHAYPYFSSPASITYRLHYVVYSGGTCMNQIDRNITVLASPRTQFDALANVCEETEAFQLRGGRDTEGFAGLGAYAGRGVSGVDFFDPRLAGAGLDTIRYTFTADNGCKASSDEQIVVYPQPHADAGPTLYILQGDVGRLEGSGSGSNITYSWTPADSILADAATPHPRVSPAEDVVYTLKVISDQGCMDTARTQVIVLKLPVVPNAFSPNGDGINDTWIIRYLDAYPSADVQVFNRYGQPVYQVVGGYTRPWDGSYNGRPLPVGTYYWVIRPGNGRRQISGSVTIIR